MLAVSLGMSSHDFPYASLIQGDAAYASEQNQQRKGQQQQSKYAQQLDRMGMRSTGDWKSVGASGEWKPEHFPHKMYDLLEDVERKGLSDIVSWLQDGKSFKIHSQAAFEERIMPQYFSGMSSYKSFRRQLNLYGIYQHRHRPNQDANAYSHEYLIRGQRHLCDNIVRKKSNTTSKPKSREPSSCRNSNGSGTTTTSMRGIKRDRSSLSAMIDERNKMSTTSSQIHQRYDAIDSHFMPRRRSRSTDSNFAARPSPTNDLTQRNTMIRNEYSNDMSIRPHPVDFDSVNMQRRGISEGNKYRGNYNAFDAFMNQYWGDLPEHLSSLQIVDEIIATFRQPRR